MKVFALVILMSLLAACQPQQVEPMNRHEFIISGELLAVSDVKYQYRTSGSWSVISLSGHAPVRVVGLWSDLILGQSYRLVLTGSSLESMLRIQKITKLEKNQETTSPTSIQPDLKEKENAYDSRL